jgi:hypothetical protein
MLAKILASMKAHFEAPAMTYYETAPCALLKVYPSSQTARRDFSVTSDRSPSRCGNRNTRRALSSTIWCASSSGTNSSNSLAYERALGHLAPIVHENAGGER